MIFKIKIAYSRFFTFFSYFETSLKADIVSKGGRWYAELGRQGTYDPFCGVVIPSCTDLNQLVSDLVEWQEVSTNKVALLALGDSCKFRQFQGSGLVSK